MVAVYLPATVSMTMAVSKYLIGDHPVSAFSGALSVVFVLAVTVDQGVRAWESSEYSQQLTPTIAELGNRNKPLDMIVYKKDGKEILALDWKTLEYKDMGRFSTPEIDKITKSAPAARVAKAKDLDGKADAIGMLRDGISALDQAAGGRFAKASAAKKLSLVKAIEGTPFFATVRGQCVTSLYDNDMAYATFGYPGSAWEKGGYITRGFQDLKWLPAPPAEASPPPFLG